MIEFINSLTLGQAFFLLVWLILAITSVPFLVAEYLGWSKRDDEIQKLQWKGKK